MKKLSGIFLFAIVLSRLASAQILPDDLPGLELWFRSDLGVTTELTTVALWEDQSGNDRDASTFAAGLRPVLVDDVLNGYPAVRFDGNNDFLDFAEVTNIRTVFWVLREDPAADIAYPRCLLGHFAQADFLRGPDKVMWHPTLSAPEVLDGITRVNFEQVDGTVTEAPVNYSIVSLVTTGDCAASSLTVDRLLYERVWDGDIFEVIVYSEALAPAEVEQVELYLANKYGPSFSVTDDIIIEDSFCPVTVCASDGFETYSWTGGSADQCLEVQNTGDYLVEVVDLFGRHLADTVHVQFPGNTAPGDQLICAGFGWTWDTGLDTSFEILWPDNSQGSSFTTQEQGAVQLIVTDAFDCTLQTQVWVEVDEFPNQVSLGPDLELCSGNGIHITDNSATPTGYLWSDGTTDNVLIIEESGEYSLIAENENGCLAYDTMLVEVIGVSPSVSFTSVGACVNTPVQFTAINNSTDEIVGWIWEFGDGGSIGETSDHTFASPGSYVVMVIGESATGCVGTYEEVLIVHELPEAGFILPQACTNELEEFADNSVSVDGEITGFLWTIDEMEYVGENITAGPFDAGFHDVTLTVETEYGCTDDSEGMFQALLPPVASIAFEGQCTGDITYFDAVVDVEDSGPVVEYDWDFGDGAYSGLVSPSHFYVQPQTFMASLFVTAVNGCADTAFAIVQISDLPEIDFNTGNACLGEVFPIGAQILSDHQIDSYFWTIDNVEVSQDAFILPVFDETGFQDVGLQVVTDLGCEASLHQLIPVWPDAVTVISDSPEIGAPPFLAQFSAAGSVAEIFEWDFGDGSSAIGIQTSHEYPEEGLYEVTLIATNEYGCSDTSITQVLVAVPVLDLVITGIAVDEQTGVIVATVYNNGNFVVNDIQFSWQQGGDSPVRESWQGSLHPGNSLTYQFNSSYSVFVANQPYLCVTAFSNQADYTEQKPSDNTYCQILGESEFAVFGVYPNPVTDIGSVRYNIPGRGDVSIRVVAMNGEIVREWQVISENAGVHSFSFDSSDLAPGAYLLVVTWNEQSANGAFVVSGN
jgi:PKD repeat protein